MLARRIPSPVQRCQAISVHFDSCGPVGLTVAQINILRRIIADAVSLAAGIAPCEVHIRFNAEEAA